MHIPVNRVFNNVARNLGLQSYSQFVDSWAEWSFEAEQYIGGHNTFLEREITYNSSGATVATGTVTFEAVPGLNSWVEIGETRFYFVDSSTIPGGNNDTHVLRGITITEAASNLASKIQDSYYNDTLPVSATSSEGVVTITSGRGGDDGNLVSLASSGSAKLSGAFLSGGKEILQGNQVRLPDNHIRILSVRVGDSIIYPTSSQFKSKVSSNMNRYYVNGNRLNLSSSDYTDDVVVTYLSVPMSPDGWPMIKQGHEEAVAHYIMWKHKMIAFYSGEIAQYVVKELERRWYWLCGKVRGDDNMPNASELLKIGKVWNSKTRPRAFDGLNKY